MKIVHLITGLGSGGAEMMLCKLLAAMNVNRFQNYVVTMTDGGLFLPRLKELGIPVVSLGLTPGSPNPVAAIRLVALLRSWRPDILQTWMYHANLLGVVAARLAGVHRLVWNIRASDLDFERSHRGLRRIFKVHALLAGVPDATIVNSFSGLRFHQGRRHSAKRWEVLHNGFELDRFRPDPEVRERRRSELGLDPKTVAVGLIARYMIQKDHRSFFEAASLLTERYRDVAFVLAGRGVTVDNPEIRAQLQRLGLAKQTRLLGEVADTAKLLPALDIVSLCSASGEGLPNALGEAMSCEIPCVTTDVGDAGYLVGSTGEVVPPRDPAALAAAWAKVIEAGPEGRHQRGILARRRVEEHFSMAAVVDKYQRLYEELAPCAE